ncbi:hypothetical protein DRQ29_06530 [bacterium]|nr:MAG: hypothetical protein DRQ29_06530 [bacterium]
MFNRVKKEDGKWYILSPKGEYGGFEEIVRDNGEFVTPEGPQREFVVKKEGKYWILRFEIPSCEKVAELGPYIDIQF